MIFLALQKHSAMHGIFLALLNIRVCIFLALLNTLICIFFSAAGHSRMHGIFNAAEHPGMHGIFIQQTDYALSRTRHGKDTR